MGHLTSSPSLVLAFLGLVFFSGCEPSASATSQPRRVGAAEELEAFRLAHQKPPESQEEVARAKTQLRNLAERTEAGELGRAAWEMLGRGDVLTPADYWVAWLYAPLLTASRPPSREAVVGVSGKLQRRAQSALGKDVLEECCGMLLSAMEKHIPIQPPLLENDPSHGMIRWDRWPDWEKVLSAWKP